MKSKLAKKMIAALLAAIMTASVVGCGNAAPTDQPQAGESKPADSSVVEESTGEVHEEPAFNYNVITDKDGNPIDLGGMEIIIRDWWSPEEQPEPKNAYEEARAEYLDWVQETYNFTIRQQGMSSYDSTPEDFANYATTGDDGKNYIFTVWQGSALVSAMQSGLLKDLSKIDCLDFTEEKWAKANIHKFLIGKEGQIYGMNAGTPEARTAVFFNKRILTEAGIDPNSLYDMQEDGTWTWDKFYDICEKVQRDIDNDGIVDVYGETSQRFSIYTAAVYSNGGEFVGRDENGMFHNKLETQETLDALNWAMDFIIKYEYPIEGGAAWDYYVSVFKSGDAAFCVDEGYRFNDFANMEDDWGFVCFPKGPNMDDYTNVYTDNVFCIPACYDDEKAWKLAFAYNLWTEPTPGYEDYEGWKPGFMNTARDTESVDLTMARLVKNGKVTYHTLVQSINLGDDILWHLGWANEAGQVETPAQKAEALRPSWNAYIEEQNNR